MLLPSTRMTKRGRPKSNPSKLRTSAIRVNVTPKEHEAIQRAADAEGISLAAWVRKEIVQR